MPQRGGCGRGPCALSAGKLNTARDMEGISRGDCAKMNRFMECLFPEPAQRHDQPVPRLSSDRAQQHDQPVRLSVLLALFIGSGCAALIYEVVWFQLLQLVIGSSAVSLGVLLGTYMGGMCLGSLLLPRVVSVRHHPFRVYAALELGIGICGILVLFGVPLLDRLYPAIAVPGSAGILLRGVI